MKNSREKLPLKGCNIKKLKKKLPFHCNEQSTKNIRNRRKNERNTYRSTQDYLQLHTIVLILHGLWLARSSTLITNRKNLKMWLWITENHFA